MDRPRGGWGGRQAGSSGLIYLVPWNRGLENSHCNFNLKSVTFKHRHENKSCSACLEWVNERLKEWQSDRVSERVTFKHRHENKKCSACREWVNASLKECESERLRESGRVSFEHRDENKSCSACQEWFNEILKECESEKEWESERMRVSNIGKRKKT